MHEAGITAVAPSFGRLFTRNRFSLGVPVIVGPAIDEHVETGDDLEIDLDKRTLVNTRNGYKTQFAPRHP